ncbi:hypothetical protein ACFPRL_08470 [Pseudoclavibacter helvolus]
MRSRGETTGPVSLNSLDLQRTVGLTSPNPQTFRRTHATPHSPRRRGNIGPASRSRSRRRRRFTRADRH